MQQAVYHGIRDVRVETVPDPQPGPGEVQVKIKYTGICGSDLHEYLHGPFPRTTFGHEACGHIVEIGPDVTGYKIGDRVCTVYRGAFAETIACPVERVITIPDGTDWQRAALIEPLSGAAYAIRRGEVKTEDTAFIAGAGSVGLMILLGLKAMGVQTVFMTDVREGRRNKAMELGANEVWNPIGVKNHAKVRDLTGGRGVDVAFEAVGLETTLKDCLASIRPRGTVIVQGVFTERAKVHMLGFVTKESTMIGTSSRDPELAKQWLATGTIAPERVVSDIIPLDDIVTDGFERLTGSDETAIKILVEP